MYHLYYTRGGYARVHKDGCYFINIFGGKGSNTEWKEFESREEAFAELNRVGRKNKRGCGHCNP